MGAADLGRCGSDAAPAQGGSDRPAIPSPAARAAASVLTPSLHLAGMIRFRPLFWPTVFTVPVVLLCLGLGFWQIERLFWKRELIAQRHAAMAAAPIAAPRSVEEARDLEFYPIADEGVFLHDKELFLGATSEAGRNGYQVLT